MNCRDLEKLVLDLARDQLTDAARRKQSLVHTKICEPCRTRLAEERSLLAGVRAVIDELAGEEAPAHVEEALLEAFRTQSTATGSPDLVSMPGRRGHWSGIRWASFAAIILVLLSVMAIFWRSVISDKSRQRDQVQLPEPSDQPGPQVTPPKLAGPQDVPKKRMYRRGSGDNPAESEVVTQFFILKEGEDLTTLENLSLVRIELPGSAINEAGTAIILEPTNARVKADVVLGQDGLARAIRFVARVSDMESMEKRDYGNHRTN